MAQTARKVVLDETTLTEEQENILKEVAENPGIVLTDETKLNAYVAAVQAQVDLNPGDMATDKGRDIIRGNAAGISRKKTPIENARKSMTEDWRKKTAAVNAVGKIAAEKFDTMRDQVRAPLTAWEEREESRKTEAQAIIDDMTNAAIVREGNTIADLQERIERIRARNLSDEMFGPRIEMVTDLRDGTISSLRAAIERLEQLERDQKELERLRAQQEQHRLAEEQRLADAERSRQQAADARNMLQYIREVGNGIIGGKPYPYAIIHRELTEKIVIDETFGDLQQEATNLLAETLAKVEAAEAKRIDDEREQAARDEAARVDQAIKDAAKQAARDAETARQAEADAAAVREEEARQAAAQAAQAEIDAANARAAAAEQEAKAERERIAEEELKREAEAQRLAAEAAAREADEAHRAGVLKLAADRLVDFADINTIQARAIVAAIADGQIPAVTIQF